MATDAAKKPAESADNSMEEILHSIRDIIAEKTEDKGEVAMPAEDTGEEEILELTEVVASATPDDSTDVLSNIDAALGTAAPAPQEAMEEPAPAPEPIEAEPEPVAEEPEPEPVPAPAKSAPASGKNLVSDDSAQQTIAALKELRNNIPKPKIQSPEFRSGNTVENLVVETLKPMLTEWLDANLPLIVRELVQKEIEKLVPHETRD